MTKSDIEACAQILDRCGVGRRYNGQKLSSFPGEPVAQLVKRLREVGYVSELINTGKCLWFAGLNANDVLRVFAGAIAIGTGARADAAVKVIMLHSLSQLLEERQYDVLAEKYSPDMLCVSDFYYADKAEEYPYTPAELRRVEAFLSERVNAGQSVAIASDAEPQFATKWWSRRFCDLLSATSDVIRL